MNRHRAKPGQLPNLNFLVDQYQHIPQTANANQDYFIQEKLRKHSSLKLFELTRFRANKWVESKPNSKPTQKEEELKRQKFDAQLRKKSYSSRPGYHQALMEKEEKFQQELLKLSSLEVFDQQLRTRGYSRLEKRILQSVKENAKKTLERRTLRQGHDPSHLAGSRPLSHLSVEEQFDNLLKGTHSIRVSSSRLKLRKLDSVYSTMSNRSKRSTLR